jgi:hypothetical protein
MVFDLLHDPVGGYAFGQRGFFDRIYSRRGFNGIFVIDPAVEAVYF